MAETRLILEPEVKSVFEAIDAGRSFLLSGGAGSGKTYSLVQVINNVLVENPVAKIACMTYTNAAVREIASRVDSPNLTVSTIHDFLWDNLKSFQVELKSTLIEIFNGNNADPANHLVDGFFDDKQIQYKEYVRIAEGFISHDEVLLLADRMFDKYMKLCDIVRDRFDFIFIDEYQDTSELVVKIFLDHLSRSKRRNIIGFFGDSMQAIYDEGVGDINSYVLSGAVTEVKKAQNRRNPRLVFELANQLRTDGIVQTASEDPTAPNMKDGIVVQGNIKFYYSIGTNVELENIKDMLNWDFKHTRENKELNLTHNLIAPRAGFEKLMEIYDADKLLAYKKRVVDYIKDNQPVIECDGLTFGQVVTRLKELAPTKAKQIDPTPTQQQFIAAHPALYAIACSMLYEEFRGVYVDKDALIDEKKDDPATISKTGGRRDQLIKHLFKIQNCVSLYEDGNHNEFLRRTEFKIRSIADKKRLLDIVEKIKGMAGATIEEVVEYAHQSGICKKDDGFCAFILKKKYLYDRVKGIEFGQFQKLYLYLEGRTPFSTQHKIKGAEFDNVLVVLDNGNWSKYNFQTLFEGAGTESVLNRTRKLFYVCCTRAKKNLVVYYHKPSLASLVTARTLFGAHNVLEFTV